MPVPDSPPRSREEVIVTEAFRRRALAIFERCRPAIIREARHEELEELIAVIQWFGSQEAMRLNAPEEYFRVPGLSPEEAGALVRLRMKRRRPYVPPDDAEPCPQRRRRDAAGLLTMDWRFLVSRAPDRGQLPILRARGAWVAGLAAVQTDGCPRGTIGDGAGRNAPAAACRGGRVHYRTPSRTARKRVPTWRAMTPEAKRENQ